MIKIIREGKIDMQVLRFTCQNCGCIFEGEKEDYNWSYYQRDNEAICSIKCPCCGKYMQYKIPLLRKMDTDSRELLWGL